MSRCAILGLMTATNQASIYDQTMRQHMDAFLESNGPIGDELARLYSNSDLQLGIAFAIARGVWHWDANGPHNKGRRFWLVEEVLKELKETDGIRVLDSDSVLGLKAKSTTRVDADLYMNAVRKLARKLKSVAAGF